jgi:hypothetical protein
MQQLYFITYGCWYQYYTAVSLENIHMSKSSPRRAGEAMIALGHFKLNIGKFL